VRVKINGEEFSTLSELIDGHGNQGELLLIKNEAGQIKTHLGNVVEEAEFCDGDEAVDGRTVRCSRCGRSGYVNRDFAAFGLECQDGKVAMYAVCRACESKGCRGLREGADPGVKQGCRE
jgi:hypothetical protein